MEVRFRSWSLQTNHSFADKLSLLLNITLFHNNIENEQALKSCSFDTRDCYFMLSSSGLSNQTAWQPSHPSPS
jgi:hypothetical protein